MIHGDLPDPLLGNHIGPAVSGVRHVRHPSGDHGGHHGSPHAVKGPVALRRLVYGGVRLLDG